MGVENLGKDKRFIEIMNNYSDGESLGELFSKIIENRRNNEIIIPVLGLQGMGKSTLINSILSENILPNDADETTCVPVEVKYGKDEKAIVHFKDSKENIEAFTRQDLNEYVSNEYNPGNEKKVSHIVLYRNIDILKNGVTIVDLPGVGSLTKENQDTTMRYIKNLCTAIFVIPTTPTIRRSEEVFIKSVWMQFSSAIFVQNNFGENKREVLESVDFNKTVLKNISKSIKTNFDDEIIVVNAYDALFGKLNNDEGLIEKSNINSLTNKLDFLVSNWSDNEEINIKQRTKLLIDECKNKINKYKNESLLSEEQLKEKHEKEEEIFKLNTKKLEKKVEEIEEFLDDKECEVKEFAKEQAKICTENIRSNIFRLIDNGVVDGNMLTEAFDNFQQQYISDVINEFFDLKEDITDELIDMVEELDNIIKIENELSISSLNFSNGQAFKFEKGFQVGIDIAGGIGGAIVFTKVSTLVGMKAGAALGTFAGPLGTVVGGLAGAAVGIAVCMVGSKAKRSITNSRGRETKRQIELLIEEVADTIKREIVSGFQCISNEVNKSLESYIKNRKKELKEIKARNIENLNNDYKSKFDLDVLNDDYEYLVNKEKAINE
ncbi:dynamin family protein [Clostridioides difficile]